MKAVYFKKPGGLEVLRHGELPAPQPKKGEALVRVHACALNRLDIWLREGKRDLQMPHVPGSDVSGVIVKINGSTSFAPGEEVVINPAIPCGSCLRCKAGKDCELVRIFGAATWGGYAEFVTVPIAQIYPKPTNLSFVAAAAFPLTFLTAWHMLIGRARLQKDETVFVWGASGGLGIAGVLIAKYLGARVIAAAKSESVAKRLKEIGVDETVIYTTDVAASVRRITDGLGADVVFESVGAKTWQASLAMLRPLGRVVIAGTTSGEMASQDLSDIYYYQHTVLGARMGTREEFEKVLAQFIRFHISFYTTANFQKKSAIRQSPCVIFRVSVRH